MAFAVADSVWESSTDSGSSASYNLSGALVGYKTFFSTIGTGNTCYYAIANRSVTTEWEIGLGTISGTSGTGILTRTTILSSSTGSLVNFSSGTKDVFCTYPASTSVYLDEFSNLALDASPDIIVGTSNLPQIKPSLNLDFANGKQLDPRITFSRNTVATYYDGKSVAKAEENLLLQSATTFSLPWVWTNGYIGSFGSELVTNGNFSSSTGWGGDTAIISSGVAAFVGSFANIYQNIFTIGKKYKLVLFVSRFVATGVFRVRLGGGGLNDLNLNITGVGTYTVISTATAETALNLISYNATADFDVDSVSVTEVIQNFVAAPDGTFTASTLISEKANATYTQPFTAVAADYTFSVYLRRVTGTGNIDITAHSGGTWVTQTVTSSWARYTVPQTLTAGAKTPGIRLVTSGDQVEVWGAQLEQRSSATAYTPTTSSPITNYIPVLKTAAANVPRFDYDPITKKPLGLLIEEGRTNLALYSEAMQYGSKATFTGNATGTFVVDEVVNASDGGSAVVVERSSATVLFLKNQVGNFSGTLTGVTSGATGTLGVNTIVDLWGANKLTLVNTVACTGTPQKILLSPDGNFAYTCQYSSGAIVQYSRNISTGILTYITVIACGANPSNMVISPDGKFLYSINPTGNISQFSIDINTGTLTALSPSSIFVISGLRSIIISPDNKFLYVSSIDNNVIYQYSRDIVTGLLTPLSTASIAINMAGYMVISPDGNFLYCVSSPTALAQFSRDSVTGLLTSLSPATIAISIVYSYSKIFMSPDGKNIYIPAYATGIVYQFSRDTVTGLVTALATNNMSFGYIVHMCFSSDGAYAFVTDATNNQVLQFLRNTTTGVLTKISPATVRAGANIWAIDISPDNNFLYVAGQSSQDISQFKINPSSPLTLTANSTVSPTGTITASTLTAVSANATLQQSFNGTAASYTFSIYLKRKSGSGTVSISVDGINFTPCAVTSTGWTRFTDTRTLTAATYNAIIKLNTAGDEVFAWGGQVETGVLVGYPYSVSSYIPTVGTTMSRAIDNASMTGVNFSSWWNSSRGTLCAEFNLSSSAPYSVIGLLSNPTGLDIRPLYGNNNSINWYEGASAGLYGVSVVPTFYKTALAMTPTLNTWSLSGSAATAGATNGNLLKGATLQIGQGAGLCINGHIKKITYYPNALTAVELKGLTS